MLSIKNIPITYIQDLRQMYYDYYDTILGKDWTDKIPFTTIRKMINDKEINTDRAVHEAFIDSEKKGIKEKQVLGLYNESELIGFTCVAVFEDNVGGIYQIYIKPEYRRMFIRNINGNYEKTIEVLKHGIEQYFRNRNISGITLEVPHTVEHLNYKVQDFGFQVVKVHSDATEYFKL